VNAKVYVQEDLTMDNNMKHLYSAIFQIICSSVLRKVVTSHVLGRYTMCGLGLVDLTVDDMDII
jgi:hypothetical protein